MLRRIIAILIGVAVLVTIADFVTMHFINEARLEKLFGNRANLEVVRDAAIVRAYRVGPDDEPRDGRHPRPRKDLAGPVVLNDAERAELCRLLTTGSSYGWNLAKGCIPNYGMKFEFQRDDRVVTALICLQCSMLEFQVDGRPGRIEDFDNICDELLRISREAFPDDEALKNPSKHSL